MSIVKICTILLNLEILGHQDIIIRKCKENWTLNERLCLVGLRWWHTSNTLFQRFLQHQVFSTILGWGRLQFTRNMMKGIVNYIVCSIVLLFPWFFLNTCLTYYTFYGTCYFPFISFWKSLMKGRKGLADVRILICGIKHWFIKLIFLW